MKQHLVRIILGLVFTLFFIGHAARYYQVPFIAQLDNIIYDARLQLTMPRGMDENIVILDFDEKSLQEVARWPWPRDVMAGLITLREKVIERDREIIERKLVEEALEKHKEQLEEIIQNRTRELEATHAELVKREKLSVLGRLTAVVSHELRNPLGVIRSSVFYLISKMGRTNETVKKHLERIDGQVTVCDTIIADLLEYTRGHISEKIKGDINACLQEIIDQIPLPNQVTMVRKFSSDLPFVFFDKEKMRRVVINIFDNALYAISTMQERLKNGEIPYSPTITIATFVSDNGIAIEVEDNGIGMDEETARHAFEPLFTTRPRGTGLGLAIVQKIVDEHGGSISLYSKINKGTKITVTLALASDNQTAGCA